MQVLHFSIIQFNFSDELLNLVVRVLLVLTELWKKHQIVVSFFGLRLLFESIHKVTERLLFGLVLILNDLLIFSFQSLDRL